MNQAYKGTPFDLTDRVVLISGATGLLEKNSLWQSHRLAPIWYWRFKEGQPRIPKKRNCIRLSAYKNMGSGLGCDRREFLPIHGGIVRNPVQPD